MKRILASATIMILILLAVGCSAAPVSKETPAGETTGSISTDNPAAGGLKFFPTYDSNYKEARNDVFDFWFDVPMDWNAADKSDNGEKFTIDPGNDKVSLLVYGEMADGSEDEFYSKLSGTGGSIEEFTFRDGWKGKKITNGAKLYYLRADGDSYIIFSADCNKDSAWMTENKNTLDYTGQSLRTSQESFGKMGSKDSITTDDLQLGGILPDMPYEKVLEIMKTKPDSEAAGEDGLDSKTLFFKDGTEIYLVNGIVYSINVISGDYVTPRGLKVGDTADKLRELYGEPDNVNDDTHLGYTIDGYELFSVVLEKNKIVEIQIDHVM